MAIPPIISNNPLFKLFRTEQPSGTKQEKTANPAATPKDIVEISDAAQQRLNGIRELSEADAPQVAADTKDILEETGLSLGLDKGFA